jgi:hypothetical protein
MAKRFPEHVLQVQCRAFVREAVDAPCSFQCFDRSANASGTQHMWEANRGIRKGQPDTLLVIYGHPIYCELKVSPNKPTRHQEDMGLEIQRAGGMWFWANSVIGYMDGLLHYGVHMRPNARLIAEHREGLFQGYLLKGLVPNGIPSGAPPSPKSRGPVRSLAHVQRVNALRRKIGFAFALVLLSAPAALAQTSMPPAWAVGAVDPRVTQSNIYQTICVPGYARTVRPSYHYTSNLKHRQIAANRYPGGMRAYEEDHLVPLELGGDPTALANLWPEPWNPSDGWGAERKDELENKLHQLVCSGHVSLASAQHAFKSDWIAAYVRYVGAGR